MDFPQRAVFFLEEDSSLPAHSKPLMLEAILHRPIMERAVVQCLADGVQRFFVVCSPRFAEEAATCFPEGTDVVISEQHAELLDFLDNDEDTLVLCLWLRPAPALPIPHPDGNCGRSGRTR